MVNIMFNFYDKKTKKDDDKLMSSLTKCTVKCKHCGHSVVIANADKCLCDNCGYYVFRNDKIEFMERLKEAMIKNGK